MFDTNSALAIVQKLPLLPPPFHHEHMRPTKRLSLSLSIVVGIFTTTLSPFRVSWKLFINTTVWLASTHAFLEIGYVVASRNHLRQAKPSRP
jgi:hypothetical protein